MQVEKGGRDVEEVVRSFEQIPDMIDVVNKTVSEVASVAEENAASSEEISSAMEEVLSSMEEVSSSAQQLTNIAEKMKETVSRLILEDEPQSHHILLKEDIISVKDNERDNIEDNMNIDDGSKSMDVTNLDEFKEDNISMGV